MKFSHNALVGILIFSVAGITIVMALQRALPAPREPRFTNDNTVAPRDPTAIASSIQTACSGNDDRQSCMEKAILAIVDQQGPEPAIRALTILISDGTMHGKGDYHDFVHRIGRLTAKKEGLNPDGFFLCPVDYNYGCQHGFFEQALVEEPDAVKAAETVCDEKLMADKPLKFLFYCYHGVGHGVMMAKAYDLDASLAVCDEFTQESQRSGCQQGVFMEAVVGYMNGTAKREGVFSETNRLAPCDRLDARFQYQCFINLGGYLAASGGRGPGAVERATAPCLKAGPTNVRPCLASVGLTSTNPGWQAALTPNYEEGETAKNGAAICAHFPTGYQDECVTAGIDNLAQFDRGDTTRMVQFCQQVMAEFQAICFSHIGQAVHNEMPAGTPVDIICEGVPEVHRSLCIQGIQL